MTGVLSPSWSNNSTSSTNLIGPPSAPPTTTASVIPPAASPTPAGVVVHSFGFLDIAASAAAVQAYRIIPGATATLAQIGVLMPYPGSILALSWYSNAAKTAGTVYFSPYVNGVIKTGAIGSWVTGTSYGTQTWPASTYVFAAGDRLDIRVSTNSAFLPTTADVEVLAYVTFDPANQ